MKKGSDVTGEDKKDHLIYAQRWLSDNGFHDWEALVPTSTELFLDFDQPELPTDFTERWQILLQVYPSAIYRTTTSKSNNLHVIVDLGEPVRDELRVAWQAALGSDPKRELLHLKSLKEHALNPIILFERRTT